MTILTGSRSTFPNAIDEILELYDLPPSQKLNATRFQELKNKEFLTTPEQLEFNQLSLVLQSYIIDVEKWNRFADVVIATQKFFRDNVEGYISIKQQEFNAEIQKFTHKGEYNNSTTYDRWNVVRYDGRTYISQQNNNLNKSITDTAWWRLMGEKGDKGDPGLGLTFRGVYNNATNYGVADAVSYNGSIYYCISPTIGNVPTNASFWVMFMFNATIGVYFDTPSSPHMHQVWINESI